MCDNFSTVCFSFCDFSLQFLFKKLINIFLVALGLRCCWQAFSSCSERGLLCRSARASHCGASVVEHRLQVRGLQQLQHAGSVVVAHGLSYSVACQIFSDQGQNPCLLNWQADSYPMHHQGSRFPLVSYSGSSCVLSGAVVSESCDPRDCSLPGSSVHGDFPCKNTGVGCHFLLQEEVLPSL